jgi:hypothetical protein
LLLVIFQTGSYVYSWPDLDSNPPIYVSHIAGIIVTSHHTWIIHWDGVLWTFYPS